MEINDGVPKILAVRSTFDIRTADPRFFTIDSTKNQLKSFSTGDGQATLVREVDTIENIMKVVIQHNLGYQPLFRGWTKEENETIWKEIPSYYTLVQDAETSYIGCGMSRPTDNEIQLTYYHSSLTQTPFTKTFDYKYEIYLEPYKDAWYN